MSIPVFQTEEFFGHYEFNCPYLLCASDCESISIGRLIELGGGSSEEFLRLKLGYPEMEGSLNLRKGLSSFYENVSESKIMVLGSPIEGIYLTLRTLLKAGDHAIVLTPAYDALLNLPDYLTNGMSPWMLKEENKNWSLDFEALESLVNEKTKLLVVNFPHNPTGFCPTNEDLSKIVDFAKSHDLYVFSDEMYRGLELSESFQTASLADIYEKTISLRGFSKTIGLPGLRFGWLTIPYESLYKEIMNWKSYTSMCSNQVNEYLGVMAINAFEEIAIKNRNLIERNLKIAKDFFVKHQEKFHWIPPQGGSISVFKSLQDSPEEFCHKMAKDHGVVLLPTKFMRSSGNFIRIGLGRENLKECIAKLDSVL